MSFIKMPTKRFKKSSPLSIITCKKALNPHFVDHLSTISHTFHPCYFKICHYHIDKTQTICYNSGNNQTNVVKHSGDWADLISW